jgi:hypothetical protein
MKAEDSSPYSQQHCPHTLPTFQVQFLIAFSLLCPGRPNGHSFNLPRHNAYEFLLSPIHATCSALVSHYTNYICLRVKLMKLLIMKFSPVSRYFAQLSSSSASTPLHPHPVPFLNTTDKVPHNNSQVQDSVLHRGPQWRLTHQIRDTVTLAWFQASATK